MENIEKNLQIVKDKMGRKYAYKIISRTWDKEKKRCVTKKEFYGVVLEDGSIKKKKTFSEKQSEEIASLKDEIKTLQRENAELKKRLKEYGV